MGLDAMAWPRHIWLIDSAFSRRRAAVSLRARDPSTGAEFAQTDQRIAAGATVEPEAP